MDAWARRLACAAMVVGAAMVLGTALHAPGTALAGPGAAAEQGSAEFTEGSGCPGEEMPPEMLKAYIKGIQRELAIHNYDGGPPDGTVNARTRAAIRQYQRDAGLAVDGCASQNLLDHLNFVLPKVIRSRPAIAKPVIVDIQTLLTRRGYYLGSVDGVVGPKTREALRRFQKDAGLPVGGLIGRALLDRIKSADPGIRGDREPAAP